MTYTPDEVAYCTREQVQATLDQSDAVRLNARIDGNCLAGSRDLEGRLHRRFYPTYGTRTPDVRWVSGGSLWVNDIDHEILTLDSLTVDGSLLVAGVDFYLDPDRSGPPYTVIRLLRDSNASWPTDQRRISMTGEFGGSNQSAAAGTLAAAVGSASTTTMTVSDSSVFGVRDLLLLDTERVIVTDKRQATTGATVTGTVDADESERLIPVSDASLIHQGEMVLIGSERMFVEDIAGNNLIVDRAQNSSVLAAHAAADIVYAPRLCTITRGAAGTTAAAHLSATAVSRNVPPSQITEAALALAVNYLEQGKSAYARTAGAGDHRRSTGGAGVAAAIAAAVDAAYTAYGRQGRIGVC